MFTETVEVIAPPCKWFDCKNPGHRKKFILSKENFERWQKGDPHDPMRHIQYAFTEMPAEDREMLLSGTHPECWEDMWKYLEEDDSGEKQ